MPLQSDNSILIIGASARAAAFSALRAGWSPVCADLFADSDLVQNARADKVATDDYPDALFRFVAEGPPRPWLYTGGLENWPALIDRTAACRPLLGNAGRSLRCARDPFFWTRALAERGFAVPAISPPAHLGKSAALWLRKQLRSAGGAGIEMWVPHRHLREADEQVYLQEFVTGESVAALYAGDGRSAEFLGATRQLVGQSWLNAGRFQYGGTVGPLPLADTQSDILKRLGVAMASTCGLRGLFGIDCILADGIPRPVEINPRYTASVEILEHATGRSLFDRHCRCFGQGPSESTAVFRAESASVLGKAILYARADIDFPSQGPWSRVQPAEGSYDQMPDFADIPTPGLRIQSGQPILTFFSRGQTVAEVLDGLQTLARDLDRLLHGH